MKKFFVTTGVTVTLVVDKSNGTRTTFDKVLTANLILDHAELIADPVILSKGGCAYEDRVKTQFAHVFRRVTSKGNTYDLIIKGADLHAY